MKIVKTCKAGSRLFDKLPRWLYKVTKQVEQICTKDVTCLVWKERYDGNMAFHFEVREQHLRAVVIDNEQDKTAKLILLRRDTPRYKDPMRPPMDVVWSDTLKVESPVELEAFATYLAIHFARVSAYPLPDDKKVTVSALAPKYWNTYEKDNKIFCGEILEFDVDGHKARLLLRALDNRGHETTYTRACYVTQLKGAKLATRHWVLIEPIGGKDRICVSSLHELNNYFRFESEIEQRKTA